ncbi:hypothetical protein FOL47_005918 [Perkinsus chesapeaki]|uniref:Amino acid transporter transmembrane domain-containing protein n=1 Tax=Perkinsus chesapeaki TaxID=330153 RepID=A0A7J6LUT6_PERCH|nr:hypothetical protein FOL47_005918 [Perkinsus chesapeaki]
MAASSTIDFESINEKAANSDFVVSRTCTPSSVIGVHEVEVYEFEKPAVDEARDSAPRKSRGLLSPGSAVTATIAVIKATLGAAALSSTYAMVSGGFIFGISLLVVMCVLMVFSLEMIVTSMEITGKTSYAELVPHLFGNAIGYWFQAPVLVFCIGAGSSYLITVTDILISLFDAVVESDTWYGTLLTRRIYLSLLVLVLILYPICLVKKMSSLRYLTLVSIFGIFYLGFVGIFLLASEGVSSDFTDGTVTFYAPTGWVSCLGAANTFIFAFCNQCNIPDIYMEMSDRSPKKFRLVAAWASSACLFIYLLICICFMLVFGSEVESSIILNMSKFIPEGNAVVIIGLMLSAVAYIGLLVLVQEVAVKAQPPSSKKWDQACRDVMKRDSYCMFYKDDSGAVCHGSDPPIPCGPANTANLPIIPPPPGFDECRRLHPSEGRTILQVLDDNDENNFLWGKTDDITKCLNSLSITNFNALFTLHNLKYGLAETYSFVDIANGLNNSVESNTCGFKKYSLDVDINGFIDGKIKEYSDALDPMTPEEQKSFLMKSIPAAHFHLALQREVNRLNDAHTLYLPPLGSFYYVLPIRFNSGMMDGAQIVTLDMLPDLENRYSEVYGRKATIHKNGDIIVAVDGKPVLEWMQEMVSDDGPYVGIYQGSLQRLNSVFFVTAVLQRSVRFNPPPEEPLNITFADGSTETINWLARVSDYTKSVGDDAVSTLFFDALINTNPLFDRTVKFETEFYSKKDGSLWSLADESSTNGFDREVMNRLATSQLGVHTREELTASTYTRLALEASPGVSETTVNWTQGVGFQYALLDDTVVVFVPNFVPGRTEEEELYKGFSKVQDFARENNVTRLLFDVSSNGGGSVLSTWALHVNFNDTIDQFFEENPNLVGDPGFIHERFQQLYLLVNYAERLLSTPGDPAGVEAPEVARLKEIEKMILSESTASDRAKSFHVFLKGRSFLDKNSTLGRQLLPQHGWYLFDGSELVQPTTWQPFDPPLSQFTDYKVREWGKPSNYSARGVWEFCNSLLSETMSEIVEPNYDKNYWTDVAFVTDGNCGSACSDFTQVLQLTGKATAFNFGALADQPMDVASFGGGFVYEYDDITSLLNIASHLGYWATFGQAEWSKERKNSWLNKPIPFPSSARARYTWSLDFAPRLGQDALPRQFYIIPPHKHLNMWARNL